jgi:hypothetical protein
MSFAEEFHAKAQRRKGAKTEAPRRKAAGLQAGSFAPLRRCAAA